MATATRPANKYKTKTLPKQPFPCAMSPLKNFQSEMTYYQIIMKGITPTLRDQFSSAFPSKYSDANVAPNKSIKVQPIPARPFKATLDDANPRCKTIAVIKSNTKRQGPAKHNPHPDNGWCKSIIMSLWEMSATTVLLNNPNPITLREKKYDWTELSMFRGMWESFPTGGVGIVNPWVLKSLRMTSTVERATEATVMSNACKNERWCFKVSLMMKERRRIEKKNTSARVTVLLAHVKEQKGFVREACARKPLHKYR
jgi:hypothetical protein